MRMKRKRRKRNSDDYDDNEQRKGKKINHKKQQIRKTKTDVYQILTYI